MLIKDMKMIHNKDITTLNGKTSLLEKKFLQFMTSKDFVKPGSNFVEDCN